jgi:hypothetical protein
MNIKIKFYYQWMHEPPILRIFTSINDLKNGVHHPYSILSATLHSDYTCIEHCDESLQWIAKIERGEVDSHVWEGQGFIHTITSKKVSFEHAIFGECPDWPIWSCPLNHYKVALQGWRKILDMPEAINSEVIVELPD